MEGNLVRVSTYYQNSQNDSYKDLVEVALPTKNSARLSYSITTPEQALNVLQNEPDYAGLISTLEYLSKSSELTISSPSPISSQIIHTLVSETIPTFWDFLSRDKTLVSLKSTRRDDPALGIKLLTSCLQNVTGLNAVIIHLKQYIQLSKESAHSNIKISSIKEYLRIFLDLIEALLQGDGAIENFWKNTSWNTKDPVQLKVLNRELTRIFGSGRIIGISAEAEKVINDLTPDIGQRRWISNGYKYSNWLVQNVVCWARSMPAASKDDLKIHGELLSKSLSLGYSDSVVKDIVTTLLIQYDGCSSLFSKIYANLMSFEQQMIIYSTLKMCSKNYLPSDFITEKKDWWHLDAASISAVGALISIIVSDSEKSNNHLISWLSSSSGAGIGEGSAIRRSVMAVVSRHKYSVETLFEKCLQQFGDNLYIRHTPTLQQEAHCQVLLLAAGYLHRKSPLKLRMIIKSGAHLNLVSNRLAASSIRARFLGMLVGEALSSLVDREDIKMDFKVEEMNTAEAKWYKTLVEVSDSIGSVDSLKSREDLKGLAEIKKFNNKNEKPHNNLQSVSKTSIFKSVEIEDKGLDNDGLKPYLKPDSDPEDSDDDPTLIDRQKPVAPVYIRDLITYLRDTESYEHQRLGLSVAAQLIRRKANFGTEVSEHAEELASLLVGIQDKYNIDNFSNMRLQGMIAILVSAPSKMGHWFSNTFFEGDYSISQRSSVLTTLCLGAQEIAGLVSEDKMIFSEQKDRCLFPSKRLPASMEKHYDSSYSAKVDLVSDKIAKSMVAPMAASLADKLTGPSIIKIRTFSSRLEVERKRLKPKTNELSKIAAKSFFFPLIGKLFFNLHSYSLSTRSVVFQPFLLSHFIKTLALILHAAGPYTLSFPQITAEFWDLLLEFRLPAKSERVLCEALCFAFLTLLELNIDKAGLVQIHGTRLLETQEYAKGILEELGEGDEDERCKMLAAGCMVGIQEVMDKYQKTLQGIL